MSVDISQEFSTDSEEFSKNAYFQVWPLNEKMVRCYASCYLMISVEAYLYWDHKVTWRNAVKKLDIETIFIDRILKGGRPSLACQSVLTPVMVVWAKITRMFYLIVYRNLFYRNLRIATIF